jgi:hemolysin activation/secretion protein
MLGDSRGGVRGYASSRVGGAARTVFRLEERWSIGGLTRHAEVGLSGFADAGWVWAGDAPFGTDSRLKVGVGVGLLMAFPPQSPRLWRLDVAVPVSADPYARWEVRLTSAWTRSSWQEPHDVARGRAGATGAGIFRWP